MQPEPINKPLIECYPKIADDDKEQLLADVRKFWLGRFIVIFTGAFIVTLLVMTAIFLPSIIHTFGFNITSQLKAGVDFVFLIVALLVAIGTFITLWVYNQSRMLITDQNVIELKQMSLLSHKTSHLNMINVEDVSVTKKGILQTIFDYGLLTIETAGEEENFEFPSTPNPDVYRRMVINAHEQAIERIGQMGPGQQVEIARSSL